MLKPEIIASGVNFLGLLFVLKQTNDLKSRINEIEEKLNRMEANITTHKHSSDTNIKTLDNRIQETGHIINSYQQEIGEIYSHIDIMKHINSNNGTVIERIINTLREDGKQVELPYNSPTSYMMGPPMNSYRGSRSFNNDSRDMSQTSYGSRISPEQRNSALSSFQ